MKAEFQTQAVFVCIGSLRDTFLIDRLHYGENHMFPLASSGVWTIEW